MAPVSPSAPGCGCTKAASFTSRSRPRISALFPCHSSYMAHVNFRPLVGARITDAQAVTGPSTAVRQSAGQPRSAGLVRKLAQDASHHRIVPGPGVRGARPRADHGTPRRGRRVQRGTPDPRGRRRYRGWKPADLPHTVRLDGAASSSRVWASRFPRPPGPTARPRRCATARSSGWPRARWRTELRFGSADGGLGPAMPRRDPKVREGATSGSSRRTIWPKRSLSIEFLIVTDPRIRRRP